MEKEIKNKLENIVTLLNDPEKTVSEKELTTKLEKILALLKNPEIAAKEKQEAKKKLEKVVELVDKAMANPDITLECCNTEALEGGDPYIHLKYVASGTHTMEQNIPLKHHYIQKTPEDIANIVTFYIEQFIEEIDSVEGGAQ